MFIYLTGLLFFPRAGEAGLAVGPGSNCKGEQCVLRAQCPSSTASPFCTHAGLSPPPLPPGPSFFSCPLAQSSRRSHKADRCSLWLRGQALSTSFCVCSPLFHLSCLLPPLPPQSAFEGALPIVVQGQILKGVHVKDAGIY